MGEKLTYFINYNISKIFQHVINISINEILLHSFKNTKSPKSSVYFAFTVHLNSN